MSSLAHARHLITRRRFLAGSALTVAALSLYSGEIERHMLETVRKTVYIRNLPTAFHGFTIAQLSDFHFRDYDEPYFLEHAVAAVNQLKPDMVALTGDFITSGRIPGRGRLRANWHDANECASILRGLQCSLRFCSLGNHDFFAGMEVTKALEDAGLSVLYNRHQAIDLRGDRMWIAGLADAFLGVPNLPETMPKRTASQPLLLLGHEPDFIDTVVEFAPVDLMLAGHTHGGQVRVPLLPPVFLPALGVKYVSGLFQVGSSQLYVNRGLGTIHLPLRFNCSPELTLFTLQPAAAL